MCVLMRGKSFLAYKILKCYSKLNKFITYFLHIDKKAKILLKMKNSFSEKFFVIICDKNIGKFTLKNVKRSKI